MKDFLLWTGTFGLEGLNGVIYYEGFYPVMGWFLFLFWAMCFYGCWLWTRQKNRHWVFALWAVFAPIGYLGIALLKDKAKEGSIDG